MAILLLLLLTVVVPPVVGVVATALEAAVELLFLCFLCYLLRQHCLPLRVGSRASIALSRAAHCHVLVAELHRGERRGDNGDRRASGAAGIASSEAASIAAAHRGVGRSSVPFASCYDIRPAFHIHTKTQPHPKTLRQTL